MLRRWTRGQVVYRRYASLFVLAGIDSDENALAVLEMIHAYVEALDRYFGAVCELDIMFHLDKVRSRCRVPVRAAVFSRTGLTPPTRPARSKAHFILDEMVMNGHIIETNKTNVLAPLRTMEKLTSSS